MTTRMVSGYRARRRQFLKLVAIITATCWLQAVGGDSVMKRHVKMPVIELSGTPAEVGEGWGKLTPPNPCQRIDGPAGIP